MRHADVQTATVRAASLIREFEGMRIVPYLCPAGLLTVGYGHRTDSHKTITTEEAEAWLASDVKKVMAALGNEVAIRCNTNQLAALCSLTFNIGAAAFNGSTIRRMVLAGNTMAASAQFMRWTKATIDGTLTVLPGLVIRRETERAMFDCVRDL